MLPVLAGACFLTCLAWLAYRRPGIVYLLSFILIAFAWRLASAIYLDLRGPVYAEQLYRDLGPGHSSLILVSVQVVMILMVTLALDQRRLRPMVDARLGSQASDGLLATSYLSSLILVGTSLFLILLTVDLFRRGEIPLLTGTEEYVYTNQYAGLFHHLLVKYGDFLAFFLGLFCFRGMLHGRRPDGRYLIMLLGIFLYLLFTGHRFSAFYRHGTFFLMPLGVVRLCLEQGPRSAGVRSEEPRQSRGKVLFFILAAILMIGFGLYRSLAPAGVRGREAAIRYLTQRVLVQQGELWWASQERVFSRLEYDPASAFRRVFLDPVVPQRNSTIPFLMELEIGERTYSILDVGSQYTGGFPEVLFELAGPVLGYVGVLVLGLILGSLLLSLIDAIFQGRFIRTFIVLYVLYAFLLFPVSGMLNFLVNWKFWVKVGTLCIWVLVERWRHPLSPIRAGERSTVVHE